MRKNFIPPDTLREQEEYIQDTILEWWDNHKTEESLVEVMSLDYPKHKRVYVYKDVEGTNPRYSLFITPLLNETDLRHLIEDLTNCALNVSWNCWSRDVNDKGEQIDTYEYRMSFTPWGDIGVNIISPITIKNCEDLLDFYWKVVIALIKERKKNND